MPDTGLVLVLAVYLDEQLSDLQLDMANFRSALRILQAATREKRRDAAPGTTDREWTWGQEMRMRVLEAFHEADDSVIEQAVSMVATTVMVRGTRRDKPALRPRR